MLKAKAKAAATAAKAKKKAAEAAAAAQAQAEEGSFAANTSTSAARRSAVRGPVVGVAAGRGRPSVIQYWADPHSNTLAPNGGGLMRIGYDQAEFEEGLREVVLEPRDEAGWRKRCREKKGLDDEPSDGDEKKEQDSEGQVQKVDGKDASEVTPAPVNKEHVAFIVQQLEVADREAKAALRRHQGDVVQALRDLISPSPLENEGTKSGMPASRLVKV